MEGVVRVLATGLRGMVLKSGLTKEDVQEIRLRVGGPLIVNVKGQECFLTKDGKISRKCEEAYRVSRSEMRETVEYISNYSMYAFEEELRQGYITVAGGHRIGICGKTISEGGKVRSMKYISFLNIRIAHEVKGCADKVLPYLREGGQIKNTLFVAPPGGGKTTMLRDVIRQLSCSGTTVGVVDERSELAACYQGMPQNDVGPRTDVLDCCPKAEGMLLLIRSMAPELVAVDEIGSAEDVRALHYAIGCGCRLMATVHGASLEELRKKPVLGELMQEELFERYVLLERKSDGCGVRAVLDQKGVRL